MFTGIIERTTEIIALEKKGSNLDIYLKKPLDWELYIDQSISHNGVCLTVVEINADFYRVTAVEETLKKTSLGEWKVQQVVNLERAMGSHTRMDGHFVQGHIDITGRLNEVESLEGSWLLHFGFTPEEQAHILVEKGSIALDGISLTVFNVTDTSFSVTIIPYTWEHTHLKYLKPGDLVNLEFDMIGKYITRMLERRGLI